MFNIKQKTTGFTLIELMVVIAIIGLLSAVLYASFSEARAQARDKVRLTSLKELQLAIELYKAQNGRYPAKGCGSPSGWVGPGPQQGSTGTECADYIVGLVPDYIEKLPTDPSKENQTGLGFLYGTDATGSWYKVLILESVESLIPTDYNNEFARCPKATGDAWCALPSHTYAVYSAGAENM